MSLQKDLEKKYEELGIEIAQIKAKSAVVWMPKDGDTFYYPDSSGKVYSTVWVETYGIQESFLDYKIRGGKHRVYKTYELAKKAGLLIGYLQLRSGLVIQACLNVDPDFEPCWSDHDQMKYGFGYNHFHARWEADYTYCFDSFGAYVSTQEKANQVVEYLNVQEIK